MNVAKRGNLINARNREKISVAGETCMTLTCEKEKKDVQSKLTNISVTRQKERKRVSLKDKRRLVDELYSRMVEKLI